MPFHILEKDITKVHAGAIVDPANPYPTYGGGTDAAIYKAAGAAKLLEERKLIGNIRPGNCAATHAFDLDADYIIHTVGPSWEGGNAGELDTLASCYPKLPGVRAHAPVPEHRLPADWHRCLRLPQGQGPADGAFTDHGTFS
jgi:O-acetyl-ADP-ribose deacetylase (regulator of RNase III)